MKQITVLLFSHLIIFNILAQVYIPKDEKNAVNFSIKNFGLTVIGSFSGLQGNITFNPSNLTTASFNISVDAGTVNTGNNLRDEHLRKEAYFNVASFPKIGLVSTKILVGAEQGTYLFEGILNIKGTKQSISFPFTALPTAEGYWLSGSFKINRKDFKVGANSLVLSDNLIVILKVEVKKG